MNKKANYEDGLKGTLLDVKVCKTGSIKIRVEVYKGKIVEPMMHHSFTQLPSVLAKAHALVGKRIITKVSKTNDNWSAGRFFADIEEI